MSKLTPPDDNRAVVSLRMAKKLADSGFKTITKYCYWYDEKISRWRGPVLSRLLAPLPHLKKLSAPGADYFIQCTPHHYTLTHWEAGGFDWKTPDKKSSHREATLIDALAMVYLQRPTSHTPGPDAQPSEKMETA